MTPIVCLLLLSTLFQEDPAVTESPRPGTEAMRAAASLAGLVFTDEELELVADDVLDNLRAYERLREEPVPHAQEPALVFSPLVPGVAPEPWLPAAVEPQLPDARRPDDLAELLFADIPTLAALVRSRQVSCVELTELFLARLRALDETLECVITFTDERALAQARALDAELADGRWRGPLHGIPWGAKDLLAARGYPTTWGARPFAEQVIDEDAEVLRRLDAAGAVLIAKLSLGALAWGDVWFDGRTNNPWNTEQGSSGSSAGPGAATAAGGVVFAIGSETYGSIVSPSERCGTTGLRPTFGRVSRTGAMALCWSLDKLGPMTRSVRDAAIVFNAIHGADGVDPGARDAPFAVPWQTDVRGWKVGVTVEAFAETGRHAGFIEELAALGVELVPLTLPDAPVDEMMFVLGVEAATAFDELTRSGQDDELVRQVRFAWPNTFRTARLVPAVEYLRTMRLRTQLIRDVEQALTEVDAIVHPSFGARALPMTNLTGHPAVVVPCGFREDGTPFGVTFSGRLDEDARVLALADAWQRSTDWHTRHPELP